MAEADEFQKALQYAWQLLSYRPRGSKEMRERLLGKGHSVTIVEQVVQYLEGLGELDDLAFSRLWIASRESSKPMGRRRLQHELAALGISMGVIDDALSEYDEAKEFTLAQQIATRQWQKYTNRNDNHRGSERDLLRLASWLQRRGFSAGVVAKICRDFRDQDCERNS